MKTDLQDDKVQTRRRKFLIIGVAVLVLTLVAMQLGWFSLDNGSERKVNGGAGKVPEESIAAESILGSRSYRSILARFRTALTDTNPSSVELAQLIYDAWHQEGVLPLDLLEEVAPELKRIEVLNLINEMLFSDPKAFGEWVSALGAIGENTYTYHCMSEYGDYAFDADNAAEKIERLRALLEVLPENLPKMRRSLLRRELKLYSQDGLDALATSFLSFSQQSQHEAASYVFEKLLDDDPKRAIDVYNQMNISSEKEVEIAKSLAQSIARVKPDYALKWIGTIEDPGLKTQLLERAAAAIGGTANRSKDYTDLISSDSDKAVFLAQLEKYRSAFE